jgi:hypothetical protein
MAQPKNRMQRFLLEHMSQQVRRRQHAAFPRLGVLTSTAALVCPVGGVFPCQ